MVREGGVCGAEFVERLVLCLLRMPEWGMNLGDSI